MTLQTQTIEYHDADTQLTGLFFCHDDRPEKGPGILVVHGGAGLDDHAKGRASKLAALGFVIFACDMYGSGVARNRERVMAQLTQFRNDPAKLCRRAQAGIDVLLSHPQVDGRIAAVGYCFGGMTVLELTRAGAPMAGAISVHGTLATQHPAQPGAVKAKLLVCHGAADPHVPMDQVTRFAAEMDRAQADWQLILYGGALHGFTHDSGPQLPGVAYNAQADARSSAAIHAFLLELFGS